MDLLRAFIAIELPDVIKTELRELQKTLGNRRQEYIRWVDPTNIHLTLKFLGDIDSERVDEILGIIRESAFGIYPFTLKAKGLGVFPGLKKIQVIWVGLEGDTNFLLKLQKNIEENLDILGFPPEQREFTPHLTLGRVKVQPPAEEKDRIIAFINTTRFSGSVDIEVKSINLIKSVLTPHGPVYSKLGTVELNT